jgi:hypothetical protein
MISLAPPGQIDVNGIPFARHSAKPLKPLYLTHIADFQHLPEEPEGENGAQNPPDCPVNDSTRGSERAAGAIISNGQCLKASPMLGNRPQCNQKIGDQLNWELVGILGGQAF